MASKFAIGDKVAQAFSNHAEGTVVAILSDLAGEHRYAVEMFGQPHNTDRKQGQSSRARQSCPLVSRRKGIDLTPGGSESDLNRYFGLAVPRIIRR